MAGDAFGDAFGSFAASFVAGAGVRRPTMTAEHRPPLGGYHPLVVSLANTGEPLFIVNRSGNRPSNEGAPARLVLDTGAAATTLTPRVIEKVGYTRRDGFKRAKVHTAIGEDHGYWVRVAVAEGDAKRQGEDGQIASRARQLKDRPGG